MKTKIDLDPMLEYIRQEIDQHEIISFDIFDTLIVRPYAKPTDAFIHIERITGLKNFAKKRIFAERKARLNMSEGEISYSDIYKNLSKKLQSAYYTEIEFEKRISIRNEEIYQVYLYALEKKKRVIITSDIYLGQDVIESILDKAGYHTYEHLFLSSTYKKTKASGELFDVVKDHLRMPAESIFHIGDNKQNDIEMAKTKGLHTAFYPKIIDRFLEEHSNTHTLLKKNSDKRFKRDNLTISLVLGLNAILWSEGKSSNYWNRLGSFYAAPLLYFFTKWVYDKARKEGVRNIAIVGRDGFNVERIFKLFDQKNEFNPQYVYLPRYVSETSNLNSEKDLQLFFEEIGETKATLLRFISDFSMEEKQILEKWDEFKLKKEADEEELTSQSLQEFILDHKEVFICNSQRKRELVYDYLTQKNLLNDHLIFVDSSTTQARAQKLIRNILIEKNIDISLFGYYYKINQRHKILNQTEIRPYRDRKYRTDKWDIMEYFMSAPEPPIISIQKEGDSFLPVYQDISENSYEQIRIETCSEMSKGVMLFAERAFEIFDDIPIINDLDTVVMIVNNLINNPSTKDISFTKELRHTINNDNHYNPIIKKYSKPKNSVPKIYKQRVNVERITPRYEHFFSGGANDKTISASGKEILGLNIAFMDRLPHRNDKADIYVFCGNKQNYFVDSLFAWNFQKGAVLQYRPMHENEIIYNTYKEKKFVSVIFNVDTEIKKILPLPVACISYNGKNALCLNLDPELVGSCYQYANSKNFSESPKNNLHHGLILLDLDSGEHRTILTQDELLLMLGKRTSGSEKMLIKFLSFSDKNNDFYIELGTTSSQTGIFDNTQTLFFHMQENPDGVIKAISIKSRQTVNKQLVYSIPVESAVSITVDPLNELIESTDLSHSYEKRYVLSETPSSTDFPYRKLQMHDSGMNKSITLGIFYSDPNFYNGIAACECRLNPRWSPCGKYFLVDSIHEGFRGIYRINSHEAIREFEMHQDSPFIDKELQAIIKKELPKKKFSQFIFMKRKTKEVVIRVLNYLTNNRMFESN
jgi:HAD superfamily hydrolase (TIGR01549 family)